MRFTQEFLDEMAEVYRDVVLLEDMVYEMIEAEKKAQEDMETKAHRRDRKQKSKKDRVPQDGRSSLRYRENAEKKRDQQRKKRRKEKDDASNNL